MPGAMRVIRGTAVGLAVIAVASLGHAAAGGTTHLQTAAFAVVAVLALLGGIALSGREWRLPRLLLTLGAAQLVIHLALSSSGRHVTSVSGHDMPSDGMAGMATTTAEPVASSSSGLVMLLAHAVAVVLTALLLRKCETWAAHVVEVLRTALRPHFPLPRRLVPVPASPVRWALAPLVLREQLLAFSLTRRGPPRADDLAVVPLA